MAVRAHVQQRRQSLDGPPPHLEGDDEYNSDEQLRRKAEREQQNRNGNEAATINALQLRGVIFPQKMRLLLENAVANDRYNVALTSKNASMLLNNVEHGVIEKINYFDEKWDIKMFQLAQTDGTGRK